MKTPSAWELAADDVIAVGLVMPGELDRARFEAGLRADHMPTPAHRAALQALYELRDENKPAHDTLVMDRAGGAVAAEWLAQRVMLFDETRIGAVLLENARMCVQQAARKTKIAVLRAAAQRLSQNDDMEIVINDVVNALLAESDTAIERETAGEHGRDFRAYMDAAPDRFISTGIPWIDALTGGIASDGRLWWIGGAYKSRKTTLAWNILLSALLTNDDISCAMLNKEINIRYNNAALVAMLAAGCLKAKGLLRDKQNVISADNLYRARAGYKRWELQYVEAVDWAIARYWQLEKRLRLYDAQPERGGLHDLASIERVIKRDIALYGGRVFFIDYLQLFHAPGEIYERVSAMSLALQSLAVRYNVTLFVLAQLNEETIRHGVSGYSPGVKGGGDPAQTANYFLITRYKQGEYENDDTKLQIEMKLSRHGIGGGVKTALDIDAASGLLLESGWISKVV